MSNSQSSVRSVSYNTIGATAHKKVTWNNEWYAKLEKAQYTTLCECAVWNLLKVDLWKLPQNFLAIEANRKKLHSYGFRDIPDVTVNTNSNSVDILVDCGNVPEGWSIRIVGPPYRRRIQWRDSSRIVRIIVIHYPEPWRTLVHAYAC